MTDTTDDKRHPTPEALAADRTLSAAQKQEQLKDWAADLNAGLRASDENMTSADPGGTGALLQRVMVCLDRLRNAEKCDLDR